MSSVSIEPGPEVKRKAGILDILDISDHEILSLAGLVHNFDCNTLGEMFQRHVIPWMLLVMKMRVRVRPDLTPDILEQLILGKQYNH
jgi:hypothetical protein